MNDYDALIAQTQQADTAQSARIGFSVASETDPDSYAEAQRVARRTGVPVDTVLNMPKEMKQQDRMAAVDFDAMAKTTPATAAIMADVERAKIAHDNIESLTGIESAFQFLKNSGNALRSGIYSMNAGIVGIAQTPVDLVAPFVDPLAGRLLPENPLRRVSAGLAEYRQGIDATAKGYMPRGDGNIEQGWYSGLASLSRNLTTLPIAFLPGGQPAALAGMTAPVFGEEFGKARDKGLGPVNAATYGASQAAIEYATEKIPLSRLVGDVKAGEAFFKMLGRQAVAEVPGEQVATILQDLNEWAVLNPEKPFSAYLAERPDAAVQTLVATLVGVGGQTTVVKGIDSAIALVEGRQQRAEMSDQGAKFLEGLNKLAAADKLLARDPETFEAFVAQAAEGGPVQQVFIDAKTLMQSGVAEQVAAVSPAVAAQLEAAVATGGQIAIPVEEYTARIAPTEYAQGLLDHLKTEPEGFSRAEAQQFMQSHAEELQAEVERTLAEKQVDDTFKASAEVVRNEIRSQLDTAARFTPQVNDAYSAMVGNFYATMAAKMGTTPEELFQRYPLKIAAERIDGAGPVLDQGEVSQTDQIDEITGLPLNTDGTVTVYHHTSAANAEKIRREGWLRSAGEPDLYFTTHAETDTGYGDTAIAVRVKPDRLQIDDEFPGGRQDYRVETPAKGRRLRFLPDGSAVLNQQASVAYTADTIEVDGVTRPTTNSNGKPIAHTEEGLRNFWRWFGDSKVVDAEGRPLVVYHGTSKDFAEFDLSRSGESTGNTGFYGAGAYFSQDVEDAGAYASWSRRTEYDAANVIPVYLSLQSPLYLHVNPKDEASRLKARESVGRLVEQLVAEGYFGNSPNKDEAGSLYSRLNAFVEKGDFERAMGTLYNELKGGFAVSELAKRAGFDGVMVEAYKRDQNILAESVAFSPTQIKSAIGNSGAFSETDPNILKQGTGNRGAFNPASLSITLLKNADLSTFLHESGHFFLEVQADLASKLQQEAEIFGMDTLKPGERQILADTDALLKWFGLKDLNEWNGLDFEQKRSYHEQFARGFEAYLFEGKAPSIELQGLFQRFRAWLLSVYRELKALNVELTDEVRGVFDRLLATNEQITLAEQGRSMMPLFTSPEQAGMTPEEFAAYQALGVDATAQAIEDLQARGLRDMRWLHNARGRIIKQLQKDAEAQRAQVRMDVRREVMSQPIYRAWQFLTGKLTADDKIAPPAKRIPMPAFGKHVLRREGGLSIDAMGEALGQYGYLTLDEHGKHDLRQLEDKFFEELRGNTQYSAAYDYTADMETRASDQVVNPQALGAGRFDMGELKAMGLPTEVINAVQARRMTASNGLHPDIVAELFGFTSGDELVRKLAAANTPKEEISALTDVRMLEQYGDLSSPEAIERAADKAIHNDVRARMVATEANALAKAAGQRKTLTTAAKEFAAAMVARLKVRNVKPGQYANAEVRAAKAAEKASRDGDIATAAAEKRNQLINTYATRAAHDALDDVDAGLRYLKRFDGKVKGLDAEYLDQIDALLERFDLRKGQSLKAIDKRKSFTAWLQAQREAGLDPDIPESLENDAYRISYKDMSVEEFRGLLDTIKQIEHLGRLKNKLLTAKDERELAAVVAEAEASIRENGGKERPVELETPRGFKPWLEGIAAGHRKLASLLRQMDGGKDNGPMWRALGRAMNDAGTAEAVMIEDATMRLAEIFKPILAMKGGTTGGKQFIPAINASLTRGGRLAVALNWGNETNRQRIMDGDRWSPAQVNAILSTLTREEWTFVQNTWDFIDSYWPDIAAKEKRVTGRAPDKVQAAPFSVTLDDGTVVNLRGGYYPIKYDSNRDDKAEKHDAAAAASDMMRGAFTRSTTRRGHTKERVENVKRPVKKTLDVITQHVSEVAHDLAWHEWLIDANRLIDEPKINQAVRDHYGTEVIRTIKDTLQGIATADIVPQTKMDQALLYLRANVSRATMGLSLTTAFLQPFGLTQSMVRIGPKYVLRGLARWGGDIARFQNAMTWIGDKSDFMRLRNKTFNRELHEIKGRVVQGRSQARQIYDASLFMLMQKMQLIADVPTWIGAYEKALAENHDDATAVAMADQAVLDSQGGGQTKDMSELQRKHPMLTMFYSYFNVTLNLAAESTAKTDFKNPLAVAGWLSDMALLMVIPALGPALILHLLKGGGDEDDDLETWLKRMAEWQAGYLLGTVIGARELSGTVAGFDYTGPPAGRIITELGRLSKQAQQGELDEGLAMSAVQVMGAAVGIPSVQIVRSWRGWNAWAEDDAPATSILLGPPPKD